MGCLWLRNLLATKLFAIKGQPTVVTVIRMSFLFDLSVGFFGFFFFLGGGGSTYDWHDLSTKGRNRGMPVAENVQFVCQPGLQQYFVFVMDLHILKVGPSSS